MICNRRYEQDWLTANARIRAHPQAAWLIAGRYPAQQWKHGRRTAVCAAGFNTPLWQEAVARAYPRAAA